MAIGRVLREGARRPGVSQERGRYNNENSLYDRPPGPARLRWPDETTHRFFSQVWRGGNDRGPAWALFFWRWGGHIDDQRALWRVKTLSIDLDDSVAVFLIKLEDPPVEVVAFFLDVGRVVPG